MGRSSLSALPHPPGAQTPSPDFGLSRVLDHGSKIETSTYGTISAMVGAAATVAQFATGCEGSSFSLLGWLGALSSPCLAALSRLLPPWPAAAAL